MDGNEIQLLIKDLDYDLDTIWHLIDYGRVSDSVFIMERVLNRIQSFRGRIHEGPYNLEGIFLDSFWEQNVLEGMKVKDLVLKMKTIPRENGVESGRELERMGYVHFFGLVRSWVSENNILLKQRIKPSHQKKTERIVIIAVIGVIGLCAVYILCCSMMSQNWGLRGEFYTGVNFDKLVGNGVSKTIDFPSCPDINTNFSVGTARWQGNLLIPRDGEYIFTVLVDDGARLFIDNQPMVDSFQPNDSIEYSKKVFLKKGAHALRLEYVNYIAACVLKLYWEGPGIDKEIIPDKYFRH